ncbi:MAG: nucleoside-diphosphate kinase, partial [Kiritimatiellota bacterium]|nr:nucleoside-diphosphate kinase [Kiritimatiellota bacterium]
MERSLVLIKPDAMHTGLGGAIISRFQSAGLDLIGLKMLHMDRALAEKHYTVHREKAFFNDLVAYITSAPIVAMVFEGENAIERIRKMMGSTDPAKAEKGTIRADFGEDIQRNAVHGSDSPQTAEQEIKL